MNEIERETLIRLAKKALKELEEAYLRIPDTDNGKAYLFRGKERIRLMLKILEG
ncbi:hypothetical protein [Thermococcus sp.]|uniref:hypothetical protein n=1 Tax=Thermococcus sp. TaxID=35749 RepID=UPI00262A10FD|nr:hypothetical protein [Thermococcus sp.]